MNRETASNPVGQASVPARLANHIIPFEMPINEHTKPEHDILTTPNTLWDSVRASRRGLTRDAGRAFLCPVSFQRGKQLYIGQIKLGNPHKPVKEPCGPSWGTPPIGRDREYAATTVVRGINDVLGGLTVIILKAGVPAEVFFLKHKASPQSVVGRRRETQPPMRRPVVPSGTTTTGVFEDEKRARNFGANRAELGPKCAEGQRGGPTSRLPAGRHARLSPPQLQQRERLLFLFFVLNTKMFYWLAGWLVDDSGLAVRKMRFASDRIQNSRDRQL